MPASEFMVMAGMIIVGLLFFMIVQIFILGEEERVEEFGYKAEVEGLVSMIERVDSEPNEFVLYCQYISLCNISVKNGILTYEKDGIKYSYQVPKSVSVTSLNETATVCILKSGDEVNLLEEKPVCILDTFCTSEECKEKCLDCEPDGSDPICIGDGFCNKYIGENCKNSVDCKCDGGVCCPNGLKIDDVGCLTEFNYLSEGDTCICDEECPVDYACSEKEENRCCLKDKPFWCKEPNDGSEARCMDEVEFYDKCIVCKDVYKLVFAANNAPNMAEYRARAEKVKESFLQETPFRECPECIEIVITDINCNVNFKNSIGLWSCVDARIKDYDMIHFLDYSGICNGYCVPGSPVTICSNNLPEEVDEICSVHELGHCMGGLCDEYLYNYWIGQGCPASGWSQYCLKKSGGCNAFNCGSGESCCGTKLKPNDPSDRTVDIMGGGGGIIQCRKGGGVYVYPKHFRDFNYERFKNRLPLSDYCGK